MKREHLSKILLILLGNCIYAAAVTYFILPAGLITGGSAGLAIFAQHYLDIPISLFVSIFNIVMFLLGAALLGKAFALTTLVSTFVYPLFLGLSERLFLYTGSLTADPMLSSIFGGLLIGIAIALVIQQGSSTGGMDIPPLLLQKYTGLPMAFSLYAFDLLILILQMTFSDREQSLYGILLVCIYTFSLEKLLLIGKSKAQVEIISEKYREINTAILHRLDRGTTLLEIEGGFTGRKSRAILTVVNQRELFKLSEVIKQIDPHAFIMISQVKEVRGRGFTSQKQHMDK